MKKQKSNNWIIQHPVNFLVCVFIIIELPAASIWAKKMHSLAAVHAILSQDGIKRVRMFTPFKGKTKDREKYI